MGTFIRRHVYERVGISLVEVCESVGKLVISVFKKTKKRVNICQWRVYELYGIRGWTPGRSLPA